MPVARRHFLAQSNRNPCAKCVLSYSERVLAARDCQRPRDAPLRRGIMAQYDVWMLAIGVAAGLACGFLNTAASSGSAVSLPVLMLIGLDPISANATNRIPVLIGAITATMSFHTKKAIRWSLAAKLSVPVTIGGVLGACLAEIVPARDMGLVITVAVLLAFALLFTKLKEAIERAVVTDVPRLGPREFCLFLGIGAWLGFIVLDGATYLLLALTLAVGLNLIHANAVKSFILIPVTVVAMLVFACKGDIEWTLGAVMGAGSIIGGMLGARLATSANARKWVFMLLVTVISAELIHLTVHYVFQTHADPKARGAFSRVDDGNGYHRRPANPQIWPERSHLPLINEHWRRVKLNAAQFCPVGTRDSSPAVYCCEEL